MAFYRPHLNNMATSSDYRPYFAPIFATSDFFLAVVAGWLTYLVRFGDAPMPTHYKLLVAASGLIIVLSFTTAGVYNSWRGRGLTSLLRRFTFGLGITLTLVVVLLIFTKSSEMFSRLWIAYFTVACWIIGAVFRIIVFTTFKKLRRSGHNLHKVIVISNHPNMPTKFLDTMQESGFEILEIIPIDQQYNAYDHHYLLEQAQEHDIDEVWLRVPLNMGNLIKDISYQLRHKLVNIRYFPDFEDIQLLNHKSSHIGGHYSLDISCSPLDGSNTLIKRLEDILIASVISILITPICLTIAILIKLTSPGPVLFKQYRNGLGGKKFKVYKFRSMEVHKESKGNLTQAQKNDPRITRLGAFLRSTSLDELPQFYNVLQGRMSIVGPRPHALEHNEYYKDMVESYMWRHKVKPGITGLAQISGYRGETDTLEKMQNRVQCDLDYINNWSLWLDLKIIFMTIYKGFIHKNAY